MKTKILITSYLIISCLFILGIILNYFDYSYVGYWTDKIINWMWLGLTFLIIILYWKLKAIKFYFMSLCLLILLSILPMAIPFFGIIKYFSTIDDYQQIYLTKNYRIERKKAQALSLTRIYVYKRKGILEKNICRISYESIIESCLGKNQSHKNYYIENAKLFFVNSDSIGIEYEILDKKNIIYHKLNSNAGY